MGSVSRFDAAVVTLDLPPGIALRPGTAEFRMKSRSAGRTRDERDFPLVPIGRPAPLAGGGTRVMLSPDAARGEEMTAFLREGVQASGMQVGAGDVSTTPSFKLCRTGSRSGTGPAVLTGLVGIELLQDRPAARIDLRAQAREAGKTLDQFFEPC